MDIPLREAEAQLSDLVRRVAAGEEVVLTSEGHAVARLVPPRPLLTPEERLAFIRAVSDASAARATPGPSAARSQDFLFDDDGLPA